MHTNTQFGYKNLAMVKFLGFSWHLCCDSPLQLTKNCKKFKEIYLKVFQNCFKNGIMELKKRTEEIKMSDLKKMTEDEFNDLVRELDYDGRDAFVEIDFSNYDLTELDFQRIINKFARCNFSGSDMTGVNMYEVEFLTVISQTQS